MTYDQLEEKIETLKGERVRLALNVNQKYGQQRRDIEYHISSLNTEIKRLNRKLNNAIESKALWRAMDELLTAEQFEMISDRVREIKEGALS